MSARDNPYLQYAHSKSFKPRWWWHLSPWRFDHNPYTRYCRWCGQQQDEHTNGVGWWWENVCPVQTKTKHCRHD